MLICCDDGFYLNFLPHGFSISELDQNRDINPSDSIGACGPLTTGGPWMRTFKAAKRLMRTCWSDILDVVVSFSYCHFFLRLDVFWCFESNREWQSKHVRLLVRPTQNLLSLSSGLSFIMKLGRNSWGVSVAWKKLVRWGLLHKNLLFRWKKTLVLRIVCFLFLFLSFRCQTSKDTENLEESVRHQSVPLADMISVPFSLEFNA